VSTIYSHRYCRLNLWWPLAFGRSEKG